MKVLFLSTNSAPQQTCGGVLTARQLMWCQTLRLSLALDKKTQARAWVFKDIATNLLIASPCIPKSRGGVHPPGVNAYEAI